MASAQAAGWVQGELPRWLGAAMTKVKGPTGVDPAIVVAISAPMAAAAIVDPLGLFAGRNLTAEAAARAEWM